MPSCRIFAVVTTNSPLMLHRSYVSQRPSMSSRKQFDPGPASDSTERLRSDNATKPGRPAYCSRFREHPQHDCAATGSPIVSPIGQIWWTHGVRARTP
jgi:hypothetical protein